MISQLMITQKTAPPNADFFFTVVCRTYHNFSDPESPWNRLISESNSHLRRTVAYCYKKNQCAKLCLWWMDVQYWANTRKRMNVHMPFIWITYLLCRPLCPGAWLALMSSPRDAFSNRTPTVLTVGHLFSLRDSGGGAPPPVLQASAFFLFTGGQIWTCPENRERHAHAGI